MNNYPLVNIYNKKSAIYLFCREKDGTLKVIKDYSFQPYFFNPDPKGDYLGFDGTKLRKIVVTEPKEVKEFRTNDSWSADIVYTKRYIIDKIDSFEKTNIKYCMLDIEVLKPKNAFPDPKTANYPITCISLYNSMYHKYRTWFINDYEGTLEEKEQKLFVDFVTYMRKAKFDLWLSWFGTNFDYPYLFSRMKKLPQSLFFDKESKYNNFATAISPIQMVRGGNKEFDNFYPAGTSVVDYMGWFKRIYKSEKSNALDSVMEKYLGKGKEFKNVDFSVINDDIKKRNAGDVIGMVELEKKFKLIPLHDEIRRTAMINFEDFEYPMRAIDSLILKEAYRRNIVLPSASGEDKDEEKYQGAYRETFATGDFYEVSDYDLSSCYPSVIKDLCLDPQNITTKNENSLSINITDRETQEFIESINITQNKDAILPSVIDQLLVTKTKFGKLKKTTPTNDPNYENICLSYDAVKAIVNTAYGCFGNRFFRLFSRKIVSLITSTARDLLHYLKDKLNELGYKVIYVDTDGCIVDDNGKNLSDIINNLIQEWSKERFNKPSSITIERKGIFKKLFVLTMCRYKGWIETSSGLKEEIKGAQIKKKDSTIFISTFQDTLIEKIFAKETEQGLVDFIANEIERIKTLPLEEIAFPNSIGKEIDEYKTEVTNKLGKTYSKKPPIFVQAYQNAQKLNNGFNKALGESFLWVYCLNENKEIYPLAFDENTIKSIKDIAWSKMIERNIHNIAKAVFESKGWNYVFIAPKVKRVKKTPKNAPNLGVEGSNLNDCKESKHLSMPQEKEVKNFQPISDLDIWNEWKGMPEFIQEDLSPFQKIIVNFESENDLNDFSQLIGHKLSTKTDTIWFPYKEIKKHLGKGYINSQKALPRYPIYVISKGRWALRSTSKALEKMKVPYHIVVEPQEYDNYAKVIDKNKILVLPFSNLGQGSIPARNWVWEHSKSIGAERHWIIDDNIRAFFRLNRNSREYALDSTIFKVSEDFVDRYENIALAGLNYTTFAQDRQKVPPFYLNTRIYSCILIKNDLPYRWRGKYNEDTDLSLRALKDKWCTVLFNAFLIEKKTTMTMKGGNTDELYKQDANFDGRLEMAKSLQEQHPDVVTITQKWGRYQHHVNYKPFKDNKLVKKEGIIIPQEVNNYGMELKEENENPQE